MFTDVSFEKYTIDENNNMVGKIEVNSDIIKNEQFIRPFIREEEARDKVRESQLCFGG